MLHRLAHPPPAVLKVARWRRGCGASPRCRLVSWAEPLSPCRGRAVPQRRFRPKNAATRGRSRRRQTMCPPEGDSRWRSVSRRSESENQPIDLWWQVDIYGPPRPSNVKAVQCVVVRRSALGHPVRMACFAWVCPVVRAGSVNRHPEWLARSTKPGRKLAARRRGLSHLHTRLIVRWRLTAGNRDVRLSPTSRGHLVGTRRFSSSNQCCTRMIRGDAGRSSAALISLIIRNR
jgi:hypothetical protein